ncbi:MULTISPECIES: AMP-binding protein [unclassified Luteococcus]|uniref:AMP-binding protein n=1 Tax=unclassified Luteococcus TaxID=2639923 RepID=UPI00313AF136
MQYRGPWPDIEIPRATLYELIFASMSAEDAQRVAIDHAETGQVLTYGQLKQQVDSVASWIHAHGLQAGQVCAVALANGPEHAVAFHGILRAGCIVTPVNTAASPQEMARQLTLTQARLVITSADLADTVRDALDTAGLTGNHLVVVGDSPQPATTWQELLRHDPAPPTISMDPATSVACLPVSSGTSGLPKAVMLSHRNLVANMMQFSTALSHLGDDNSIVAFLPFSHIYALSTTLNFGLWRRFPLYTMSAFQAHLFLDIVATRRPTILFIVPPVATFLSRNRAIETIDWDSVRLVVSGAAPLDQGVGEELERRLSTRVVQGYGMTELSPVTHVLPPDRTDLPLGTIGQAISNTTFRVVDPATGRDVEAAPPGDWSTPGELWVRGPQAMLGYLHEQDATEATLDADGYVHTGDLVQVDHEGTTRIVDRIKELIKRRGFQIPPAELEAHLVAHPDVVAAAVLGIGQTNGDQVPHALLVLREGADPASTPETVVHWVNRQVAQYKHLGGATVVDELPLSAAGKILRRELPQVLARARAVC